MRHSLSSYGIETTKNKLPFKTEGMKTKKSFELIKDTGMGHEKVQIREKNGVIEFRKGIDVKGKHWKKSRFSDLEEAIRYLRSQEFVKKDELEKIKDVMDYDIDTELERNWKEVKDELYKLSGKMEQGRIDSLTDEEQKRYWELQEEKKELQRKKNEIHNEAKKKKEELKEKWLKEHLEEI